jgi:hypothetical protein
MAVKNSFSYYILKRFHKLLWKLDYNFYLISFYLSLTKDLPLKEKKVKSSLVFTKYKFIKEIKKRCLWEHLHDREITVL